jgi:hypothetical protein
MVALEVETAEEADAGEDREAPGMAGTLDYWMV